MIWISPHNQQKKHQGHFSWFMAVIHDPPRPHLWGSASRRGFRWIDPTPTPRNQAWGSEHHKTRTLRSRIHHKYWKYHVKRVNVCICMCVIHHIIYIDIVYIYILCIYIYILCIYIYTHTYICMTILILGGPSMTKARKATLALHLHQFELENLAFRTTKGPNKAAIKPWCGSR